MLKGRGLLDLASGLQPYLNPPQTTDDEEYCAAIGKFIITYAGSEVTVHQIARKLSGVTDKKARLLFAGMRIGDVVTRVNSLLGISKLGAKARADISDCLEQFDCIGKQRDKMVHRSVDIRSNQVGVTNIFTAKSILAYERDLFSMSDILGLTLDCLAITIRLSEFIGKRTKKNTTSYRIVRSAHGPWRYKPPQPQNKRKATRRRIAEALARQPHASEE